MSRGRASFEGRYPKEIFVVAVHREHWREGEDSYWTHRIYSTQPSAKTMYNREVEDAERTREWRRDDILEIQFLRVGVAHSGYELLAYWRL